MFDLGFRKVWHIAHATSGHRAVHILFLLFFLGQLTVLSATISVVLSTSFFYVEDYWDVKTKLLKFYVDAFENLPVLLVLCMCVYTTSSIRFVIIPQKSAFEI